MWHVGWLGLRIRNVTLILQGVAGIFLLIFGLAGSSVTLLLCLLADAVFALILWQGIVFDMKIGETPHRVSHKWLKNRIKHMTKQMPLEQLLVSEDQRGGYSR